MRSDYRATDADTRTRTRIDTEEEIPGRPPYRKDRVDLGHRQIHATDHSSTRMARPRPVRPVDSYDVSADEISARQSSSRWSSPAASVLQNERSQSNGAGVINKSAPRRFAWPQFTLPKWFKYLCMALAIALMVAVSFLQPIDKSSESQIDSAMTRALIGFGIARTLNGVISVAQGTEFAVQPAGVGVNFSPGEILDPINDLVERFSWVMLVATSSLGIQKVLLEVSSWIGISFMLAGAAVFWLLTKWQAGRASAIATFASRLLLVMLVLRFLIPVGSIANDWVYRQFLEPRFESSSQQLEEASERIREISTRTAAPVPESNSISQKAKNLYNSMTSKFDFDSMLQDYKNSAENVSEHAVNLIVVFLLQTIIFPLIFLYFIYRAFRYLLLPPARSGS